MDTSTRNKALELFEEGNLEELYELIKPYIDSEDALALNLYSKFSLNSANESIEEFDARSMTLKLRASELGLAEASYTLACEYMYGGDAFDRDMDKSAFFFERAIDQGDINAKCTYGTLLYYGNEKKKGLKYMEEAANCGLEAAIETLESIRKGKA